MTISQPIKRPRGRPRKERVELIPSAPKRSVGRPRTRPSTEKRPVGRPTLVGDEKRAHVNLTLSPQALQGATAWQHALGFKTFSRTVNMILEQWLEANMELLTRIEERQPLAQHIVTSQELLRTVHAAQRPSSRLLKHIQVTFAEQDRYMKEHGNGSD